MKYRAIHEQLQKRQAELNERLEEKERFGLEQSTRDSTGELSLYDNHPADMGTELFERGKDIALHEILEQELIEVNEALEKIEAGTYGVCEATGKKIPYERLEANPTAKTVVEYAKSSFENRRPVEEDVLEGFEKYNYDNGDQETQFDAEDAYQAVARFNENRMTFEDASLDETDEPIGYVEDVEAFLATDMYGYNGEGSIDVLKNVQYEKYRDTE